MASRREIKRRNTRIVMVGGLLALAAISLSSVGFSSWQVGGGGMNAEGPNVEVGEVAEVSDYATIQSIALDEEFCPDGFVSNETLIYECSVSIVVRLDYAAMRSSLGLSSGDSIPYLVDLSFSYSSAFDTYFNLKTSFASINSSQSFVSRTSGNPALVSFRYNGTSGPTGNWASVTVSFAFDCTVNTPSGFSPVASVLGGTGLFSASLDIDLEGASA